MKVPEANEPGISRLEELARPSGSRASRLDQIILAIDLEIMPIVLVGDAHEVHDAASSRSRETLIPERNDMDGQFVACCVELLAEIIGRSTTGFLPISRTTTTPGLQAGEVRALEGNRQGGGAHEGARQNDAKSRWGR